MTDTNDYYCTECEPCKGHAGLGVGHIWTNVQCPAYRTHVGTDCDCDPDEPCCLGWKRDFHEYGCASA